MIPSLSRSHPCAVRAKLPVGAAADHDLQDGRAEGAGRGAATGIYLLVGVACTLTGQSTPLPRDTSRELSTVEFSLPRSANEFITGYFGLMLSPDEVPVTRRFTHGTR